ncbi:sensor histidine kinase [Marinitenerispora sediminis]|uniref:sensor histidine kinase n=1 Tax=Marinitenerispora sediminis TaxID=1931232 RepID=UPI001F19B372|nr:ATP-binding protein [Marinitenerispora sediminis]
MRATHRRWSLARQFLAFQLAIMVGVLTAVAALSLGQSFSRYESLQGRRLQSTAESMAAMPAVRLALDQELPSPLASTAENTSGVTGLTSIVVADEHGTILTSHDPDDIGRTIALGESTVLSGRSWIGPAVPEPWEPHEFRPTLVAHVPVFNDRGRLTGLVAIGQTSPSWWQHAITAAPYLGIYLGVAGGLGAAGSLLLAARIKRQTLGMEPGEIAATVEQREAMLHGVKEGVLGLDLVDRVTLANRQAIDLLGLPADCLGRTLADLGLPERLHEVLAGGGEGVEQVVLLEDRVITLNRMPMTSRGERIGSVTTLRDRTELVELRRELDVTRHTTDALRAQAHDFSNRLHTISGLIALEEYDEVTRFVMRTVHNQERLTADVTDRVADPSLAALLIAKAAMAAERGVRFELAGGTRVPPLDPALSADLVTVVGNLVDNALDALRGEGSGTVRVEACRDPAGADADGGGFLVVSVRDTGPGVAEELAEEIFRQGFSTKESAGSDPRGLGLAIIRLICRRRGGTVSVRNAGGAVFTARLPIGDAAEGLPAVSGAAGTGATAR